MKKKLLAALIIIVVIAAIIVLPESLFSVNEDEYANVVRFSKTVDTIYKNLYNGFENDINVNYWLLYG